MKLHELTISQASALIQKREIKVTELTQAILDRINEVDGRLNAYITVTGGQALAKAAELDASFDKTASTFPLYGVPLAIKDNMCTKGIKTTCASRILVNFVPPYESTATGKLDNYVLTGKTNLDEFAMGSSTENSGFFVTKNPWDTDRAPGGSSGGSAVAVSADECIAALGSDTGGSVRQPASFCGVVGLKPTYGRVSRYGLVAYASSLDQIGPITKTVEDAAILLSVIAGHDDKDSTSAPTPVPDYTKALVPELKGLRIGIPAEYFVGGLDEDVESAIKSAIKQYADLGATIIDISLPHTSYAVATYYILATSEASSNLARYDGVKYGLRVNNENLAHMYMNTRAAGFGSEAKRRIMLGAYALSAGYYDAYYKKAQQVRTLIKNDFDSAFSKVDVLLTPTSPTTAFRLCEKLEDPLQMYLTDIFTISVNLAGVPAISIPAGFDSNGLPIGLQIIGRHFDESTVLKAAYAYEQSTTWHTRKPPL